MTSTALDANGRRWKRYSELQTLPLDWAVTIPSHWSARRLKEVASVRPSNVDKKSVDGERAVRLCNYVDVYKNDRIASDMRFMEATATNAQIGQFSIRAGDVVITKDSETWDDIAVPAYVAETIDQLVCGYHLALIRPDDRVVDGAYLSRCFAAEGLADQFRIAANGITRFGLDTQSIKCAVFPVPPLPEQRTIAGFLDRETARIDELIGHKERLIALLEEKRQAVISHAVTRGLDPVAPLKDSGVPWIGMVPKHWSVEPLKHGMTKVEQGWSPQCENRTVEFGEWGVLKVGCVNSGVYDESECKALPADMAPIPELVIHAGDVLMSRSNTVELVGMTGIVHKTQGRILLCDKLYRLGIRRSRLDPEFAVYLLRSAHSRAQIEPLATGASSSMRNISADIVQNLVFAFPPLEEQRAIAQFVEAVWGALDRCQAGIRGGVQRLQEYRTALISAAVTGQIDVRGEV